jgi:hypothetical protein
MAADHFIVYAARSGARSFYEGISDPTFFMTINKILDEGLYLQYTDPRHNEVFKFEGLREFVVHEEGLEIPNWEPFMKALHAQDDGTGAKALYARMIKLDPRLTPALGSEAQARRFSDVKDAKFAQAGDNQYTLKGGRDNVTTRSVNDGGNSAAYLAARLKKAERDDLLAEIGPGQRFSSMRAAAIEAGIIIPFPSLQLKEPMPTAQKLLAKKGKDWCLALLDELSELVLED